MNKYLTLFTILLIGVANITVFAFNKTCISIYDKLDVSMPLLTEYIWLIINKNIYFLFSILSIIVVLVIPNTKYKDKGSYIEQVIIGMHLLILSILLFSLMLPFISMCATIE